MAFEATKREWGELYAFFRLLADGYVFLTVSQLAMLKGVMWKISRILPVESMYAMDRG